MKDREKIIKGFDICLETIDEPDCPNDCPYFSDCSKYENRVIFQTLMRDALELLKAQEPIEPKVTKRKAGFGNVLYCEFNCGNCNKPIERLKYRFCPYCGKGIKWDESEKDD